MFSICSSVLAPMFVSLFPHLNIYCQGVGSCFVSPPDRQPFVSHRCKEDRISSPFTFSEWGIISRSFCLKLNCFPTNPYTRFKSWLKIGLSGFLSREEGIVTLGTDWPLLGRLPVAILILIPLRWLLRIHHLGLRPVRRLGILSAQLGVCHAAKAAVRRGTPM